jgi:polyisoprenoid-binding protein YceI
MKRISANIPAVIAALSMLFCSLLVSIGSNGQTKYQSSGGVKLIIEGTSNIHDWDMTSKQGACSAEFLFSPGGHLAGLTALQFTVPAESLKSDKKSMDKNTYKALNTEKHGTISFASNNAAVRPNGTSGFILTTRGNLTISGVTRVVDLTANGVLNPDRSITYSGTYKLKMTDYKVTPPSIMFGAIKTGDAVTVKFDLVLKAQ